MAQSTPRSRLQTETILLRPYASPIVNTPPELLAQVLLFAFPYPPTRRDVTDLDDGIAVTSYLRMITCVCTFWRDIALSIYDLWTMIIIDDCCISDPQIKRKYLESVLQRSKGKALDIRVLWPQSSRKDGFSQSKKIIVNLLEAVIPEMHRCKTLELQLAQCITEESMLRLSPSPPIQEMKLWIRNGPCKPTRLFPQGTTFPNLHTINIHFLPNVILPEFNTHSIRVLFVLSFDDSSPGIRAIDRNLSNFEQLEELIIDDPSRCCLMDAGPKIELPRLKVLQIGAAFPPPLSSKVSMPSIDHLVMFEVLRHDRNIPARRPNLPQLKTLQLEGISHNTQLTIQCLREQPSLEALSINGLDIPLLRAISKLDPTSNLQQLRVLRLVYFLELDEYIMTIKESGRSWLYNKTFKYMSALFALRPALLVDLVGTGVQIQEIFDRLKMGMDYCIAHIEPHNAVPLHSWKQSPPIKF